MTFVDQPCVMQPADNCSRLLPCIECPDYVNVVRSRVWGHVRSKWRDDANVQAALDEIAAKMVTRRASH